MKFDYPLRQDGYAIYTRDGDLQASESFRYRGLEYSVYTKPPALYIADHGETPWTQVREYQAELIHAGEIIKAVEIYYGNAAVRDQYRLYEYLNEVLGGIDD